MRRYYENLIVENYMDVEANFYIDDRTKELVIFYTVLPNEEDINVVKIPVSELSAVELKDILKGDFINYEALETINIHDVDLADIIADLTILYDMSDGDAISAILAVDNI